MHKKRPWSALEKQNSNSISTLGSTAAVDYFASWALPEYIDTVLVSCVEEVDYGLELVRVHAHVHFDVDDNVGKGKGKGKGKAPARPRSPSAHERPDLSVFVRQAVPRAPPAILVREGRESVGAMGARGGGSGTGKRVQFVV